MGFFSRRKDNYQESDQLVGMTIEQGLADLLDDNAGIERWKRARLFDEKHLTETAPWSQQALYTNLCAFRRVFFTEERIIDSNTAFAACELIKESEDTDPYEAKDLFEKYIALWPEGFHRAMRTAEKEDNEKNLVFRCCIHLFGWEESADIGQIPALLEKLKALPDIDDDTPYRWISQQLTTAKQTPAPRREPAKPVAGDHATRTVNTLFGQVTVPAAAAINIPEVDEEDEVDIPVPRPAPARAAVPAVEERQVITYPNGSVYTGEVKNGRRHGKGELRYSNGEWFEGEFRDDMRYHGFYHGNGWTRENYYRKDVAQGFYTVRWSDGGISYGIFKDGKFAGLQAKKTGDGKLASDYHRDGKRVDGTDYVYWSNQPQTRTVNGGNYTYYGQIPSGRIDGIGKMTFHSGSIQSGRFSGRDLDLQHGFKINDTEDGPIARHGYYNGAGRLDGKDSIWLCNDGYFEGTCANGLFHGIGTYYTADGKIYTAEFDHNEVRRLLMVSYPDGTLISDEWQLGMEAYSFSLPVFEDR